MLPFNREFKDLLSSFTGADVRFMLVGAYALAYHGHVRATRDLDVWVECSPANAARVCAALADFGAALDAVTREVDRYLERLLERWRTPPAGPEGEGAVRHAPEDRRMLLSRMEGAGDPAAGGIP